MGRGPASLLKIYGREEAKIGFPGRVSVMMLFLFRRYDPVFRQIAVSLNRRRFAGEKGWGA
jgi:hypothetical protein